MKIALVHVADHGGGAERSVLTLHRSLRQQGHDCRLFVGHRKLDEAGVIEIPRERSIPGLLRITTRLERQGIQNLYAPWFRKLDDVIGSADVVHLHSLWKSKQGFADLTGIERLAARYPTVLTLRDGWMLTGHCACPIGCDRWKTGCGRCPDLERAPSVQSDWTHLNWKRKRRTLQRSDVQVTAVSRWLGQQIGDSPLFEHKTVHVVHNSVDAQTFCPVDQRAARTALGLPLDRRLVLLAGQSIEGIREGIAQDAIAAMALLDREEIVPVLVGHSAERVATTFPGRAVTLPFQQTPEAMAECYRAADLTVVPSAYETFGRVAAESLCCGTPVVAYATGGLSDIVTDECGLLVAPGDVQGLAKAIARMVDDTALRSRLAVRGAASAQARFDVQRIAAKYTQIYRQAIASRRGQWPRVVDSAQEAKPTTEPESPTISVILPAWNAAATLPRAVDSLLATQYPALEIVIVEDGSSDETREVADRLCQQNGKVVKVLQHPGGVNRGVSASRNLGMRQSSGDLIAFLDADDYVYPHRFSKAVAFLQEDPSIDGVHELAELVFPDTASREAWPDGQTLFGFTESVPPGDLAAALMTGRCWATSAILFRRDLIARVGGFDPRWQVAEDCHFWFRLASRGKIVSGDVQRPVSAYWRHPNSAYQPSAAQKLPMIRAMADYVSWLRNENATPTTSRSWTWRQAETAMVQYICRGLIHERLHGSRRLARAIAWTAVRHWPRVSRDRTFVRQAARLLLGR